MMWKQVSDFVSGKKTYTVMIAGLLYAILGWYSGGLQAHDAVNVILGMLGLGGLRNAL